MRRIVLPLILLIPIMASAQIKITITAGGRTATATLADNAATAELAELLASGPVTVEMSDYGGFEKVGSLPRSFTTSNRQITTVPGDIMLYQGNQMVIFYGSNSWSYTPLGHIDGATAESVKTLLGSGRVTVILSLDSGSATDEVISDNVSADRPVFDLQGRLVTERPLPPGLYVSAGRKLRIP
ncbi:MAG: hypothetical protein K2I64_01380 [Muribaculaceae bacterium]|nr:hypothetical protein [Muribaculaceae bacterium]